MVLYLAGLLLLGQLVAAAQFGNVFRRDALDNKVAESNASAISIIGGAYNAALSLDSGWLSVDIIDDMQVSFLSKSYRRMKTLERADRIMVQSGDIVLIYQTNSIDPHSCKDVTAENLQFWVENEKSEAAVFGVVIRHRPAPKKETAQFGPNSYFKKIFYKPTDNITMEVLGSAVQIDVKIGGKPIVYVTAEKSLAVRGGSGTNGKVLLFKKSGAIFGEAIHSRPSLPSIEKGDRVIIVATPPVKDLDELLVRGLQSEFVKRGVEALEDERYSKLAILAAEIDEAVDYLAGIALFGRHAKVEHALFNTGVLCPTWLFEGDTMIIRNYHSTAFHIKKNEKANKDVRMLDFTSDRVELPGLKPGDIVLIITAWPIENHMRFNLAIAKNALSGCINSTELRDRLHALKPSPSINIMAAIVSDKIELVGTLV